MLKIRNVIRPYRITCFCLNCFFFFDRWCEKNLFESFAVIFVKETFAKMLASVQEFSKYKNKIS